jgi:ABC-2 type transport system ATP-binding protein
MSEMALTAEHLIIIGRGRLIRDVSVADFVRESSKKLVRVRSPQAGELRELVLGPGVGVRSDGPGVIEIEGLDAEQIGETAAAHEFVLHELSPQQASLEDAFMALTQSEIEYRTADQADLPPSSDERITA